jgi:hypothetical protein
VALRNSVVAINAARVMTPVLSIGDGHQIGGLEIDAGDNSLLLTIGEGLYKLTPNRALHQLLTGAGTLRVTDGRYSWCAGAQQLDIENLASVGNAASDRAYAAVLITRAKQMLALGADDKAFAAAGRAMALQPDDVPLRRAVAALMERTAPEPSR